MNTTVAFRPWVGKDYSCGGIFHQKVLVLGESHYCDVDKNDTPLLINPDITRDTIHEIVYDYTGERYMRTFVCFERAIFGFVPTQEQRESLWESVAFYDYVQFLLRGPRCPINGSLDDSELAFKSVLEGLMPDRVIVWGRKLYNVMPNWGGHSIVIKAECGIATEGWVYIINDKEILCMMVHHPSCPSGKNWGYWHPLYNSFLHA